MGKKQIAQLMVGTMMAFAVVAMLPSSARAASPAKVIYSFAGDEDGEYIDSDLVVDGAGNLYGTSVQGGDFGSGTIFQLSRSGNTWTHTILYSFTGQADGGQPYKGVTLDAQGNLYGATVVGGTGGTCPEDGCGVVYKLTKSGTTWTQSILHNFTGGADGYEPGSGLTFDTAGNLYGMTPLGGANNLGVIFQLKPDQSGNWTLNVIHAFGGPDGSNASAGRLIFDATGHMYGVATTGGTAGAGTAFELSPTTSGAWKYKTLYSFKGQPDAGFPYGGLVLDRQGNLLGTTYYDGANDLGAVYKLTRGAGGQWTETVIHSFTGGSDGNSSISNLVFDKAGNLYGTTSEGGAGCSCGTIFKLTPSGGGNWTESTAYRFRNTPDGGFAYNGMVADSAGNLFGATVHGGVDGEGAVYQFKP